MNKIAFIGAGNMASAICGGIISTSTVAPSNIILYDKLPEQYSKFNPSCNHADSISEAVEFANFIFFSVKPQNIKDVLSEISKIDISNKVFISICAGITIESIGKILGNAKIIRTMPNTPLLIGQGVTALCRSDGVSDDEFAFATSLFATSGYTTEAKEEDMNKITAITSSSPAYVYLFAKAMLDGARQIGFDGENALEMICKTLIGSANMILNDTNSVDDLIKMVKSPNGTTERALNVFEDKKFVEIIAEAMDACVKRADELAKLN